MCCKFAYILLFFLSVCTCGFGQANVTVKDTDTRILYSPSHRWRPSSLPCTDCLDPGITGSTWHDGTNLLNGKEEYYTTRISAPTSLVGNSGGSYSIPSSTIDVYNEDKSMTAFFQFSGTAIYLYAIIPEIEPTSSAPTVTNLTFTLDNVVAGHYLHTPSSATAIGFTPDVNVFMMDKLSHSNQHTLEVNIGPNSVLLLDRIIFTEVKADSHDSGKSKKIATFAGAVGGSFGVFLLLAIGLGINLIMRRKRARRRELEERANQSENPTEFVPRYFPGTLPPPYSPPVMSYNSSAPAVSASSSSSSRSFNELTPGTTVPDEEGLPIPQVPPPSFVEATTSSTNVHLEVDNPRTISTTETNVNEQRSTN